MIEKVNVGFMAVLVPAGTSEIRFTYQTPGLALGAAVTLAGVLILLLYLWLARRFDRAAAAAPQEPESALRETESAAHAFPAESAPENGSAAPAGGESRE